MKRYFIISLMVCLVIVFLSGCSDRNTAVQNNSEDVVKSSEPEEETAIDVDYVELMQNGKEYIGKLVRVAGQIDYRSDKEIYFYKRLGLFAVPESAQNSLGYKCFTLGMKDIKDLENLYKDTYITAIGIWNGSSKGKEIGIKNVKIELVGDAAKEQSDKYYNEWLSKRLKLTEELPLSDFKLLLEDRESYADQYVRVVGKISHVGGDGFPGIVLSIGDKREKDCIDASIYGLSKEEQEKCTSGEYVIVSGKFTAEKSPDLIDCYIEVIGDEAKSKSDEIVKEWNKNYLASCEEYNFEEISRYPDKYIDKDIKIKGLVIQTDEENGIILISTTMDGNNIVYVNYYSGNAEAPRILEDDIVTFYGKYRGIKTYLTVLGNENSVPCIQTRMYEIN